ncbi:uncharacterized protein HMPREF1120_05006 [Exophiala dermatitidis NIH/UT8656]|uniref:Uncharacterized protein n=1 Tax=Exophiala dermatitidis (strain ATCC 34100 / CBS 525.76 / NIH/UT8656) TaxID=858893 RepID=H6BZ81_EXODN|nr:uncharacterized protein HMPREF1120_05006 [Exophiala dermatitidis NIH/UT8656]EHY56944.1 hypothetical protein HMPREF1120_05006 [Exophiala dermatitidis NIH/UT8656]
MRPAFDSRLMHSSHMTLLFSRFLFLCVVLLAQYCASFFGVQVPRLRLGLGFRTVETGKCCGMGPNTAALRGPSTGTSTWATIIALYTAHLVLPLQQCSVYCLQCTVWVLCQCIYYWEIGLRMQHRLPKAETKRYCP